MSRRLVALLRVAAWCASGIVGTLSMTAASADADSLDVTILGSGYVEPLADKYGASILVEAGAETLLFDVGRGAAIRINQLQIPFHKVDKVFLTHLHSDHVVGLPDLYLTGWVLGRRNTSLRLWGPKGTARMARHLVTAFDFDLRIRRDIHTRYAATGAMIEATEFAEGVVYQHGGVTVTAFAVDHGPIRPAFGFRVDYAGKAIAISGDTRPSPNLVTVARGVDVLFHEAFAPNAYAAAHPDVPRAVINAIAGVHTTPAQAGDVFAQVKPRLAVFYHIDPGPQFAAELRASARRAYGGRLEVGEDLMYIEIGDTISVSRRLLPRANP